MASGDGLDSPPRRGGCPKVRDTVEWTVVLAAPAWFLLALTLLWRACLRLRQAEETYAAATRARDATAAEHQRLVRAEVLDLWAVVQEHTP